MAHEPVSDAFEGHGGDFVAEAMRAAGLDRVFTLSGGHIFPIYDGMHTRGMQIVDVRHEQTAGFAAEGHAKLARVPGVAALTAGPGVTNGVSPIASAHFNGSPLVVLGGRAPQLRWGQGSLQEMEHVPIVASITKHAETIFDPAAIGSAAARAFAVAAQPHRGPVFLDVPLEVFFTRVTAAIEATAPAMPAMSGDVEAAVRTLSEAERPVLLIGSDVWADGAEKAARDLVERLRIPAFMNGMGRGVLPADHELVFSQARGHAFKRADLVIVAGAPLDFRLGFGKFGDAKIIHVADHPAQIAQHVELVAGLSGPLAAIFDALGNATERDRADWIGELRATETDKRTGFDAELRSDAAPIHPARVYGDLVPKLQRDAIVICDGGDFVSYAGKFVEVYEPGGWLDPGPYGCLGTGPGYALAAGLLHPDRQIVLMMGDGAAGFGMGDWDTLVRFGINVTIVVGNNGIWGLEKHPMKFVYGYDVAADLRPETRYDEVMRSLGGYGEMVSDPAHLSAALDRALAAEGPSLLNVVTDPAVAYPRSSNLA